MSDDRQPYAYVDTQSNDVVLIHEWEIIEGQQEEDGHRADWLVALGESRLTNRRCAYIEVAGEPRATRG